MGIVPVELVREPPTACAGGGEDEVTLDDGLTGESIMFVVLRCWIAPPGGGGNSGAGEEAATLLGACDIATFVAPSFATDGLTLAGFCLVIGVEGLLGG
jgi:hypothetical protein